MKYKEWIEQNVKNPLGMCNYFCTRMKHVFPELTLVRGHYTSWSWGRREHWWLTTPEGVIIDPTIDQFPKPHEVDTYEPWDESKEEPTGMCPNCGDYAFKGRTCCSDKCSEEYTRYVMGC